MTSQRDEVTIYDVAALAGVAASTVSRTFSRPERVSFKTAEKVRAAADELGYRSGLATPAAKSAHQLIGLIVPSLANPFFQELYRGAMHAARTAKTSVVLLETSGSVPQALRAVEALSPVTAGLLLASTRLSNGEIQKIARSQPTVVLNRPVRNVPSVLVDNYEGAVKAMLHLAHVGVRTLTYLTGPADSWADAMRWRGILEAAGNNVEQTGPTIATRASFSAEQLAAAHGITPRRLSIDEPTLNGGRRAFATWRKHPTDAVLCFNDVVAIGFMDQARREDVDVPGDVMVAGFDNTEFPAIFPPGLTTVAAPLRTVGRVGAANLIALAQGIKTLSAKPRLLPTRLIVRGSTYRREENPTPDA